jgi:hypothetical protein
MEVILVSQNKVHQYKERGGFCQWVFGRVNLVISDGFIQRRNPQQDPTFLIKSVEN